ncbi:MAG: MarC family protein [Phycisphaerales bacterium JB040]
MDGIFNKFVLLFTLIDPIGSVPVFIAVSARAGENLRRRIAVRSVAFAAGILLFFIIAGQVLIELMQINLAAFRLAGGVILFLLAMDMIFGESKPEHDKAEADRAEKQALDLAVYPMAVPSIAGPGSILAVVVLTDNNQYTFLQQAGTALLVGLVLLLTLVCLLLATRIHRLIGDAGASIISRVMGMITAAIAADMILAAIDTYYLSSQGP